MKIQTVLRIKNYKFKCKQKIMKQNFKHFEMKNET